MARTWRNRDGSRIINILAIAPVAIALYSCALDLPVSGVRVKVPDVSGNRSRNTQPLGSEQLFRLDNGSIAQINPSPLPPPSVWSDFTCLGLMVTAPDIPEQPLCGSNYIPGSSDMPKRPGYTGGLIPVTGGEISMKVPSGPGRLVQLFGLMSVRTPEVCPAMSQIIQESQQHTAGGGNNMGDPVELARANVDLFSDATVTLRPDFSAATVMNKVMFKCEGGGSSYDPAQTITGIPGLRLWLNSEMLNSYNDGDTLVTWVDSSGTGHSATAPTTFEPNVVATSAGTTGGVGLPNGRKVAHFAGTDYMHTLADTYLDVSQRTVIVVANMASSGYYTLYSESATSGGGASSSNMLGMKNMSGNNPQAWVYDNAGNPFTAVSSSITTPMWHAYSLVWRTSGMVHLYIDGVMAGSSSGFNTAMVGHLKSVIGANGYNGEQLIGDLAEVIVYDREIGDSDREKIQCAMKIKYALPGAWGHGCM